MGNNSKGHFFTFLLGAATGALIGLLYAPDKGKNTRDRLNFLLDKYSEKLQEIIEEMIEGRDEPINAAKTEGERIISDAIKEAERLKNEVDALRSKIGPQNKEA
jgi:gas vesicle protein